ncbi:hypothetical protein N431DRAFT_446732 [Stipitochalara longipes BDJ]|nr:hypothetical protein N431DRAFT_446732 [Stipitochalara longipes BDJ]
MKLFPILILLASAFPAFTQIFPNTTGPHPPTISAHNVIDQSAPFRLQLISHNKTLNNSFLSALHEGAALESLGFFPSIFGTDPYNTFKLNTSRTVCNYENGTKVSCGSPPPPFNTSSIGTPGVLIWDLPFSSSGNETQLSYEPQFMRLVSRGVSSNMAFAVISFYNEDDEFDSSTAVAFDKDGCMNLQDNVNNAVAFGPTKAYYRWYICYGWFENYIWSHLVWVYGYGRPDFPHCDKVDVKRIWA